MTIIKHLVPVDYNKGDISNYIGRKGSQWKAPRTQKGMINCYEMILSAIITIDNCGFISYITYAYFLCENISENPSNIRREPFKCLKRPTGVTSGVERLRPGPICIRGSRPFDDDPDTR
jgi:hypothetical protein